MAERLDGKPRRGWTKPGREAVKHPTILDIAWVAGVFEGEGSVSAPHGSRGSMTATLVQKDLWLLDRVVELFGGHYYLSGGYTTKTNSSGKSTVCGRWEITGPRARGFVFTIFSFLSPRRRAQIKAALGGNTVANV